MLVLSLIRRLNIAGFIQHSIAERNILVQPGPLSKPLAERSMKTPSFRIIDFGRGRNMKERAQKYDRHGNSREDADIEERRMTDLLSLKEEETW